MYNLQITFRSNEHPFQTYYDPVKPILTLEEAKEWGRGMQDGLGSDYSVVVFDGKKYHELEDD